MTRPDLSALSDASLAALADPISRRVLWCRINAELMRRYSGRKVHDWMPASVLGLVKIASRAFPGDLGAAIAAVRILLLAAEREQGAEQAPTRR